jgi:hypothetical protein
VPRNTRCLCLPLVLLLEPAVSARATTEEAPGEAAVCHRLDSAGGESLLCGNVWISPQIVATFETTRTRSTTFRALLAFVRGQEDLHVSIAPSSSRQAGSKRGRARTLFKRHGRSTSIAKIELKPGSDNAALLGHEFEHVRQWVAGELRSATVQRDQLEYLAYDVERRVANELARTRPLPPHSREERFAEGAAER